MKLKLFLLYSIHATYEIIQMTEPQNISTGPSLPEGDFLEAIAAAFFSMRHGFLKAAGVNL